MKIFNQLETLKLFSVFIFIFILLLPLKVQAVADSKNLNRLTG